MNLPPVMATFEPCAGPKFQSDVPSVLPLTGRPNTLPWKKFHPA